MFGQGSVVSEGHVMQAVLLGRSGNKADGLWSAELGGRPETLKREKGRSACLKWERLMEWIGALKVGRITFSHVAACVEEDAYLWLVSVTLSGCQEHGACFTVRQCWGGGLTSSRLHLWLKLLWGTASGLNSEMQTDYSQKIITAMSINPICWIGKVMLKRSAGSTGVLMG